MTKPLRRQDDDGEIVEVADAVYHEGASFYAMADLAGSDAVEGDDCPRCGKAHPQGSTMTDFLLCTCGALRNNGTGEWHGYTN